MKLAHPFLAARAYDRPLMMEARAAAAIEPVLRQLFVNGAPEKMAGVLGESVYYETGEDGWPRRARQLVPRVGKVGVIAVEGTLVHKGAWLGTHCGMTSYQALSDQIAECRADPSITGIVFEFDTPGGEVSGAFDCAAALRELSAEKETLAICTDMAYSAGYLLASQCRQIVVPPSGGVGSIGVITMHVDMSKALADAGVAVTIIAAGAHKADGNPYEPLPADVRNRIEAEVEEARVMFAEAVQEGRGSRLTAEAALETEAQCFGGVMAVNAGLADLAMSPKAAFEAFVARHNPMAA